MGASGDLAPLAHLALPLIGRGQVEFGGSVVPAMIALREAGLEPLTLEAIDDAGNRSAPRRVVVHTPLRGDGRKLLLKQRVEEEVEGVRDVLGAVNVLAAATAALRSAANGPDRCVD